MALSFLNCLYLKKILHCSKSYTYADYLAEGISLDPSLATRLKGLNEREESYH